MALTKGHVPLWPLRSCHRGHSIRLLTLPLATVGSPCFGPDEKTTVHANSCWNFYSFVSTSLGLSSKSVYSGKNRTRGRASTVARPMVQAMVQLTDKERLIFDKLLATLQHNQLDTQLRVAGGWVRDKLLGKTSTDIDIALDNMLGSQFCEKVNEYLHSVGDEQRDFTVIKSNPEQSKHLEAAHMRLHGVLLDFVNLRSESYSDGSRIPTMKFGTPEEDAYRRDLTINSLFYNINTGKVEDLTKRGIKDLNDGIIATPLPPMSTFLDDPLRVLRAVRFGARFNYQLAEELKIAAASEDVKLALSNKVSKERIGTEIDLMLKGNRPLKAMRQLANLQLFPSIFALPLKTEPLITEDFGRVCVDHLEELSLVFKGFGSSKLNSLQQRICFFSALLFPLRHIVSLDTRGKSIPVSTTIIRESLKLKVKDADEVVALHKAAESFRDVAHLLCPGLKSNEEIPSVTDSKEYDAPFPASKRIRAGLLLREIKELWRAALLLSSLFYDGSNSNSSHSSLLDTKKQAARIQLCLDVEQVIVDMGLDNVWQVKPVLDGTEVMKLLGLKTGGPQMKEWMDRTIQWQLANPDGTAEDCKDWFQEENSKRLRVH